MDAITLNARLQACGVTIPDDAVEKLCRYHELLLEWNEKMDLTAVTEEGEMVDRHYVDSLMALTVPGLIPESGSLIDVGTGAGFPGMPLAIACPQLSVTLVDAQQKRLTFLQAVIDALGLTNVRLFHARAEDSGRAPELREQFDLAVARAVAPTPVLAEYLLPFVRIGGKAVCWKGPALAEELEQGKRAAFLVGGKLGEPIPVTIPGRDWQHQLLPMAKVAKTARLYPRKSGTPTKKPLG